MDPNFVNKITRMSRVIFKEMLQELHRGDGCTWNSQNHHAERHKRRISTKQLRDDVASGGVAVKTKFAWGNRSGGEVSD